LQESEEVHRLFPAIPGLRSEQKKFGEKGKFLHGKKSQRGLRSFPKPQENPFARYWGN